MCECKTTTMTIITTRMLGMKKPHGVTFPLNPRLSFIECAGF